MKQPGTEFMRWAPGVSHASAHDMVARVEVMDDLGLYAQILYPNAAGFGSQKFADVKDDELRRLCASIYNEGMIEIQEISGGRLLPMALLPWWDIEGSVARSRIAPPHPASTASRCAATRRTAGFPILASACGIRSGKC